MLENITAIKNQINTTLLPGSYIASGSIKSGVHMKALLDKIVINETCNIRSCLIHLHSIIDFDFMSGLSGSCLNDIQIVSTVRDPYERLHSAVRMFAREADSIDDLRNIIKRIPEYFDNSMYNYLSQTSLKRNINDHSLSVAYVNDDSKIKNIKSRFLSMSGLPNIIQPRFINSSTSRSKGFESRISKEDISDLCFELIENGSIDKDIELLTQIDPYLPGDSKHFSSLNRMVHPYTAVFLKKDGMGFEIVKTKDIVSEIAA